MFVPQVQCRFSVVHPGTWGIELCGSQPRPMAASAKNVLHPSRFRDEPMLQGRKATARAAQ